MNIALFDAAKYWSGGAERVYLCAKGFKDIGHNVVLICLPTSRLNKLLAKEVKIYNIHPVFDLDFLAGVKILFLIIKHKIEVLDIHSPKFYWLGVFTGKLLKRKVFITRNVEYRKKGIKKQINKILYKFCDGIISVSKKIKYDLISDFCIPEKKIKVIYDGFIFPNKNLIKNLRGYYNISDYEIIISIIGRIEENKGQDFAVEILKKLKERKYCVRMFIIGPIEDKKFYHSLLEKINMYNLNESIIFTGFVSNVYDYILSSDIILCCSKHEGMIKSVIESLYLNTPVVATSAVRINEIIQEESTKFLFILNHRELYQFLQCIEEIIKNLDFYRRNKNNPVQKWVEEISHTKMLKQYIEFYENI
ncbi:MAG: glycosyltransferase [Endomicrobia bacterium]|nr:glycosyltransferase [Endomicrobiia bacterium]